MPNPLDKEEDEACFCYKLVLIIGTFGFYFLILYAMATNRISFGTVVPLSRMASVNVAKFREGRDDLFDVPISKIGQDDPRLLKYIDHKGILIPPSSENYTLKNPTRNPSMGQCDEVKRILKNMENGFFVESGALDGETRSNTLDLEINYGWKGLLVEPNPSNFKLILEKHRRAWIANVCLSLNLYPHLADFHPNYKKGKLTSKVMYRRNEFKAQCMPLYTLLLALNVSTVDYWSLDIEGHESEVLKTVPFDRIRIRVLSVQFLGPSPTDEEESDSVESIRDLMGSKGYRVVGQVTNSAASENTFIFAHPSVSTAHLLPRVII